jgi:hypothetical protein
MLGKDFSPTEGSLEVFCLNFVIDEYIKVTSYMFTHCRAQNEYLLKASVATEHWIINRKL